MLSLMILICLLNCCTLSYATMQDFFTLSSLDIHGNNITFEQHRGTVVLVVNGASECGYTDQHYKDLKRMHDILSNDGNFAVWLFPCNQFGQQEPGTQDEILSFLVDKYEVEFPLFAKTEVVGTNAHPVYKFLHQQTNQAPDWNFWKYLIGAEGNVIRAWGPNTKVPDIFDMVKEEVDKVVESDRAKLEAQLEAARKSGDKIEAVVEGDGMSGQKEEL